MKSDGNLVKIETGYSEHGSIVTDGESAYLISGSPTKFPSIIRLNLSTNEVTVLREANQVDVDPGYYSIPREITYPTTNDGVSHGYFYAPKVRIQPDL